MANECALEALAGATFQRMVCVRSRSDSAKVSADFAITNARGRSIGRLNWLRRSIWYELEALRSLFVGVAVERLKAPVFVVSFLETLV